MKNKNKNFIWNIVLISVVALIVLYIVLQENTEEIKRALSHLRIEYLLACLAMVFLWQYSVALLLRSFARLSKANYSRKDGLINALIAAFFHNVTPGSSGGQFAQMYVFAQQGVSAGNAAGILWSEFIIYQTTMCLFGLLLIFLRFSHFYSQFSNLFIFVIIGFVLNSAIIVFLYALGCFSRFKEWVVKQGISIAHKFHLIKDVDTTRKKFAEELQRFDVEAKKLKERKQLIFYSVLLCLIRLLIYYSIPYVLFIALGVHGSWGLYIDCLAMGSFVAIASGLIPVPGASGGTEAIFVAMFANFFSPGLATTAMLLWRFFTFYFLLFLGGAVFLYVKWKAKVKL